jgi:hypothetical protein
MVDAAGSNQTPKVSTSSFAWNANTASLGIGTATPAYKLDIVGSIARIANAGTAEFIARNSTLSTNWEFGVDGSGNGFIYSGQASPMVFSTSGTERMRLDSSGNLGLGVTPSAWRTAVGTKALQIGGSVALFSQESSGTYWTTLTSNAFQNTSNVNAYINTGFATSYTQTSGQHIWGIAPSGTAGNAITFTQAMTLDASSNLTVNGYFLTDGFSSPTTKYYSLRNGYIPNAVGGVGMMAANLGTGNNDGLQLSGHQGIIFSTNSGTERMRIDSSGNLGLGITPSAWGTNTKAIEFGGTINNYLAFNNSGVSGAYVYWNMVYDGTNNRYKSTGVANAYGVAPTGDYQWYNAPSGTAGTITSLTQALTLNTNGNLALQGGTTTANGVGITFPATQSASSNANCLDDYEEGTWAPQIGGTSGGAKTVTATNFGWYRKVGTLVTCGGTLSWNSADALSGGIAIKNLPYVSNSTNDSRGGGVPGVIATGLATNGVYTGFQIVVDPNTTFAYIIQVNGSNYSHNPTVSNSGTVYGFCFSYISAS